MDYFASLPTDEIGHELQARRDEFYQYLKKSGRLSLYKRLYDQYYRAYNSKGRLYASGEMGEYMNLDVNDFRNIIQHLKVLTVSQRPSFDPRAINTDTRSQEQTVLATGLLDYYLTEKDIHRILAKATEFSILYGDGWAGLDWDASVGEEVRVNEQGAVEYEGDIVGGAWGPLDAILDITRPTSDRPDWLQIRTFENKWNLAAKYAGQDDPELYDRIVGMTTEDRRDETVFLNLARERTDLVAVYTFYHAKTDAVPQGRLTRWITPDVVLTDGELPFKEIPVYRIAPADQDQTPFGYSISFDLLPLQEGIDHLVSTVITNQSTFGVSTVLIPEGANISVSELAEGLNAITYNATVGEPKPLNLTATPKEIFETITMLREWMQVLSGVNSVARGQPEASLKSGAALALVQSMAIQFNSGLQQGYADLAQDIGTGIIRILQAFAKTERVATIVGKSQRAYLRNWTGEDLSNIDRVVVDLGNPLMRTTAGRVNMAEQLLSAGMVETPDQYLQVLTTGKLEALTEGKQAELMNIKSENEALGEGARVRALITDNHALHVAEHKAVLSSPESRQDPEVVTATTQHIQEHVALLRAADPALLVLLGQQPIPPSMPPSPPGQSKGEGQAGAEPPEAAATLAAGPTEPGVRPAKLPEMPNNALTGKPYDPQTGGL